MNIYERKFRWKVVLLLLALAIASATLWYTNNLATKIAVEETKKVENWAKAIHLLPKSDENSDEFRFLEEIVTSNRTIPVILTNEKDEITSWRFLDSLKVTRDSTYLPKQLNIMRSQHDPIMFNYTITVNDTSQIELDSKVYYKDSTLLSQLKFYPLVQLATIGLFLLLSYLAFSSARNAEQNQVWVGMAKETAHQLGTPLSSMLGWVEYLRAKEEGTNNKTSVADELQRDVDRLQLITDRFSKIGSQPKLNEFILWQELEKTMKYVQRRASEKIKFHFVNEIGEGEAKISPPLFDWVVENVLKNALDAMDGTGNISLNISENNKDFIIDLHNDGKALPKSKWKTIFEPGYSTKKRGWGLGLSLSKRIIEQYHNGKIFVQNSKDNIGTTFRILIPK